MNYTINPWLKPASEMGNFFQVSCRLKTMEVQEMDEKDAKRKSMALPFRNDLSIHWGVAKLFMSS
jgi:hypothetical protein